ncbi:phosphatase PAP2 family protein [Corynebacterium argentoratense]|uniref:phosphatase PAP2 family protein n=1 Tax=Corynebacterium argentoratense TaxID=42817 RepID=UPI001F446628|nr:phosphatase PAP2 family protein [Corynebacterium argentoratense]MCF1712610.1 phosphatase PAP2 family protein [Corynebacterium argentoratense]
MPSSSQALLRDVADRWSAWKAGPEWEADALVAIQSATHDVAGVLPSARVMSHVGEHALGWLGLSAAGALFDKRRRRQWCGLGTAALVAHAASVVLKRVVRRPRPHDERIVVGVSTPSNHSFPSSHATSTTATMAALAVLTGSSVPYVGAGAMMLSRMILGVHYPTDVTCGALVGVAAAKAVMPYFEG